MKLVWIFVTYAAMLGVNAWINRREFGRCPEKGERYKALPLPYKLACWCGVIPLFVGSIFTSAPLFLAAFLSFALLQGACVRWYEKNGHLPPLGEP
ncbi:MAG: hypothetical protein ACTHNM_09890 [Dyella sp.]|uniref:hypothetical protein n=1 Tax=Dyella sp. TaxID=1869338 RepID=UPI003F7E1495